jgi:3,4-dihydroxy 2-butanone 4-phosphate synthase/GTP cyclohydrolase II
MTPLKQSDRSDGRGSCAAGPAAAAPLGTRKTLGVLRGGESVVRTERGTFRMLAYRDGEGREHLAVVKGAVRGRRAVLCRVHSECLTGEVFRSRRCDCGPQLDLALERVEAAGSGVVVYLRQEGRGIGLVNKIRAYALQDAGADTVEANEALGFPGDLRRYDVAAEILRDLGVRSVVLMTNNPEKLSGLREAGFPVDSRVPHVVEPTGDNAHYMETKRVKMGHLLDGRGSYAPDGAAPLRASSDR